MLFPLGRVVATPGALAAFERNAENPTVFLRRHQLGDWGEVDATDAKENTLSVRLGYRILSAYILKDGTKIWIITEADRSSTCVLLPDDS